VAHLTEHNVLTSRKKTEVSHWLVRVIFLTSSSTTAITTPLWWRKKTLRAFQIKYIFCQRKCKSQAFHYVTQDVLFAKALHKWTCRDQWM